MINETNLTNPIYLLPVLTTAMLFPNGNYDIDNVHNNLSNTIAKYSPLSSSNQYELSESITVDTIGLQQFTDQESINLIVNFSKKILDNAVMLDDDILISLNENFWDLI